MKKFFVFTAAVLILAASAGAQVSFPLKVYAGGGITKPSSPDEFKDAYRQAEASDRATMIHIETDLYGPNPPSSSWWDVPVSDTSRIESTQKAYEEYVEMKKPQRHYLR